MGMIGLVGECVRGRAVWGVGGWGEQGAGYKKPAVPPLPRREEGEVTGDPKQSEVNYSRGEVKKRI